MCQPGCCLQVASPVGGGQHQPAASPNAASAVIPASVGNEGAVDPNLLQNLLSQLQAPQQQQAQVCIFQQASELFLLSHCAWDPWLYMVFVRRLPL